MPVLFLGHGSPMNALESNSFTDTIKKIGSILPTPKAVLVISAHWMTTRTKLTAMAQPRTIHDFYGFPEPLFKVQYPSPGAPDLAVSIQKAISSPTLQLDRQDWGLDHGAWSLLVHLYPKANIPILQLSLDLAQPPRYHFDLGSKLKILREQSVLILGSGNIVHNLGRLSWEANAKTHDWAMDFDEWVRTKAIQRDFDSLVEEFTSSPAGRLSVPTTEHYLPLLYILGASDENDQLIFDNEGFQNASISMRSLRFQPVTEI